MRARDGAGVPHGAAGAGYPGQPAHDVVSLDRARRRHHRRDLGGRRSRHGGARMSDIRLEGVSKRYGPVAAADDVDLAVAQGEFVTILGPSGSGKTTLLSLIAGLNRPTAGRIFIGGRDVTDAPAQQRNIGLVFQSYALFPHMTVLENVLFPLGVRKIGGAVAPSHAPHALEFLGIANFVGLEDGRTGLVRPERVRIGLVGTAGKTARVVEAIYLGQMVRYHLALENGAAGAPMVAAVPFVGRAFATGERVAVSWEAADIWPV